VFFYLKDISLKAFQEGKVGLSMKLVRLKMAKDKSYRNWTDRSKEGAKAL